MDYKFRLLTILGFTVVLSSCTQKTVNTTDSFESIELPDGSLVLLNHNSAISYDKGFNPRNIKLEGEAYFKVVKAEGPFTVITELGKVKVLGTRFDVNSTEDELEVEVESGKVEVEVDNQRKEITGGQRATYKKESNSIEIGKAEYKFKIWLKELEIELEKLGKVIKRGSHKVGKELEKEGKKLNKKLKELN